MGSDRPEEQNEDYRNGTEINKDLLKTGDLSLTPKYPTDRDIDTYVCVYNRDGDVLMRKHIRLTVTESTTLVIGLIMGTSYIFHLDVFVWIFAFAKDQKYMRIKMRKARGAGPITQANITASGDHQVNVAEGTDSVLLPCSTTLYLAEHTIVEWTDSRDNKVHVIHEGFDQLQEQNKYFRNRTEMKLLKTGDVSLTLKHPTDRDTDTYTCTIYNRDGDLLMSKQVFLLVTESIAVVSALILGLPFLIPLPVLTHEFFKLLENITKWRKTRPDLQKEEVKVHEGDDSVLLPFKTEVHLPKDATVEWRRPGSEVIRVHVYHKGQDQPDYQNKDYQDRTEMNADPLKTGDLSLTLYEPSVTDHGVYTCIVYKDGFILEQKAVRLWVNVYLAQGVHMSGGEKSILLPFGTEFPLAEDATVAWTWTRSGYKFRKLHVYQNGRNQPDHQDQDYQGRIEMKADPLREGDLSLTLKDPRLTDVGFYTCTVYKTGDGLILEQKVVELMVKDSSFEEVEVHEGSKSVLLPFKTNIHIPENAIVEWTWTRWTCEFMKVHVYQNGQNQPEHQNQAFKGRTEMKADPLRTGDLSLILKEPKHHDAGAYTCTVYKNDGLILEQRVVGLSIVFFTNWVQEVTEGEEFICVTANLATELPEDATVEWRRFDFKNVKVCDYQRQRKQPHGEYQEYQGRTEMKKGPLRTGDLSLTLKKPRPTDTGLYVCTVYDKNRDILSQHPCVLSVQANWKTVMEEVFFGERDYVDPPSYSENRTSDDIPLLPPDQLEGVSCLN
ncbi:uncharacterized protein KZ484_011547 [Pholidichthys leucotaenia]